MGGTDHYEVLNVERTATTAEIKSAYRRLVRQVHPDQGGNAALFRLVQEAWATLSDPQRRAAYDRTLGYSPPGGGSQRDRPSGGPGGERPGSASGERSGSRSSESTGTRPDESRGPGSENPGGARAGDSGGSRAGDSGGTRSGGSGGTRSGDAGGARSGAPGGARRGGRSEASSGGGPRPGAHPSDRPEEDVRRPVQVVPPFGQWRIPALTALVTWLALVIVPYVVSSLQGGWSVPIGIGVAALATTALPPHWLRLRMQRRLAGCGVVIAILLVVVTLPFVDSDLGLPTRIWVYTVVAGLVVVRILTGRWSAARRLDRAIGRHDADGANVWGRPGMPLVDDGFVPLLPEAAQLRSRRTAQLLEEVVRRLPAAKLVHGVPIDGFLTEHVLLAGSRLAVIASATWPGGRYGFDTYGSVLRNGHPFGGNDPALDQVVAAWQTALPGVEVRGFLVVHSSDQVTADASSARTWVVLPAGSAAGELISWLRPVGNVLDRRVLYQVLYRHPL